MDTVINSGFTATSKCDLCGWPIIHLACNDALSSTEPYSSYDYWAYCASPVCRNHKGEGYYLEFPGFIVVDK